MYSVSEVFLHGHTSVVLSGRFSLHHDQPDTNARDCERRHRALFSRLDDTSKTLFGDQSRHRPPAEADADGELGLDDSFIGSLELKFKPFFGILTYSLTISIGLAKCVHCILITMAGRSLQPFNSQSAIFSHTSARHIENAHVVFGVWFSFFGCPKVALRRTMTICPCP